MPYAIETLSKLLREGPEPMPYDHIFIEPVGPCGHVGRGHVRDMERGAEPPLEEWFTLGKRLGSSRAILFVCHTQDLEHVSEVDLEVGRKMAAYADTNHEPPWELVYVTHQGNFKASELLALPGLPVFEPCRYRLAPLPTERLSRRV